MRIAFQCSDGTWLSAIDGGGILANHRGDPGWRETFSCIGEFITPPLGKHTYVGTYEEGGPLVWGEYDPQSGPVREINVEFEGGLSDGVRTRIRGGHRTSDKWNVSTGWWGAECGGGGVISANRLTSDHNSWNYFTIRDMDRWNATRAPAEMTNPPRGAVVGVGTDNCLFFRRTLDSSWTRVPSSGSVTGVAVTPNGRVWGIGTDQRLYVRETLTSAWSGPVGGGTYLAITAKPEYHLLGVGTDKLLYFVDEAGSPSKVENSGDVISVAALADSSVWGIGTNNLLYKRTRANFPPWAQVGNGSFLAITAMPGGNLLGVGWDKCLYIIDDAGSWTQVQNSGDVTAIACYM